MILRLLPILLATCLVPDIYIYCRHLRHTAIPRWLKILFWGPSAGLLFFSVWLTLTETLSPENMDAIQLFLSAYMLLALPKTAYLLVSLPGKLIERFRPGYRKANNLISSAVALEVLAVMILGQAYGPTHLRVRHDTFRSPQLPRAFDGYKIVQFTDLHLTSMKQHPDLVHILVDSINAQQADAICFTGDLISTDVTELYPFLEELSRLQAPDGVFSILGNHDYLNYAHYLTPLQKAENFQELIQLQKKMGWTVLRNENRVLHRDNDSIAILGVENDGQPPFPQRGDLNKAQNGLQNPASLFQILLSHDPSHWRRKVLPETNIQLTLSGHTHGMQFLIGNWSPAQYFYPEWNGFYNEGQQSLYVSIGVGGALIPFRFGAWPEINVLTLRCK